MALTEAEIKEILYEYIDRKNNSKRVARIIDEQEPDDYEERPRIRGRGYREKPSSYLSDEDYDEWN